MLAIQVKFESEADRDIFIDLFRPLAKYVAEHEPQTLSYELAIADTDPTLVLIHERCGGGPTWDTVSLPLRFCLESHHPRRACCTALQRPYNSQESSISSPTSHGAGMLPRRI